MRRALLIAVLACAGAIPAHANDSLDLTDARRVISLAAAEATRLNAPGGAQQDDDIATAAAAAFEAPRAMTTAADEEINFLAARDVAAAFAKGAPLIETGHYKIHASRRTTPGMGEVHDRDTDVIYVLDGTATIVTGGTLVDGKTIARDEVRGSAISGGETRRLAKGDVLVVPNGTPHWFKEVTGTFLYYVVKVTAAEAAGGTR